MCGTCQALAGFGVTLGQTLCLTGSHWKVPVAEKVTWLFWGCVRRDFRCIKQNYLIYLACWCFAGGLRPLLAGGHTSTSTNNLDRQDLNCRGQGGCSLQPVQTSKCLERLVVAVRGVTVQVVGQLLFDRVVDPLALQLLLCSARKTSLSCVQLCTAALCPGQPCSVCLVQRCAHRH